LAARDESVFLVADLDLPELLEPPAVDRDCPRDDCSFPHRTKKVRGVGNTDRLACSVLVVPERGPHACCRFDERRPDPAVHDPIRLQQLRPDRQPDDHFVGAAPDELHAEVQVES